MIKEKKNYLTAKAKYETVLRLKKECQEKVLNENEFYTTEGEKVNLLNDYLMSDNDSIKYWKLCFTEYKNAGLNPRNYDDVIDYRYQEELRKAEDNLIEWGKSKIKGLTAFKLNAKDLEYLYKGIKYNLEIREKVINLTMCFCKEK